MQGAASTSPTPKRRRVQEDEEAVHQGPVQRIAAGADVDTWAQDVEEHGAGEQVDPGEADPENVLEDGDFDDENEDGEEEEAVDDQVEEPEEPGWFQDALRQICTGSEEIRLEGLLSDVQLRRLAQALRGSFVTMLSLVDCDITDTGVQHLAECLKGSSLKTLDLLGVGIGDEGTKVLADALQDSTVETLILLLCSITDVGMKYLATALKASRITSLTFGSNHDCTDEGVKHLAGTLAESPLTSLELVDMDNLTAEGVKALADVLKVSSLTELVFGSMELAEEGFASLVEGLKDSGITQISLGERCSEEFRSRIDAIVKSYVERRFVLQMQVEALEAGPKLTFRSLHGDVKAVLDWTYEQPVHDLPEAVLNYMRISDFPPPFKHFKAFHLKIVTSAAAVLDVGPDAPPLRQQLGLEDALKVASS